jgi:hypothetical protein
MGDREEDEVKIWKNFNTDNGLPKHLIIIRGHLVSSRPQAWDLGEVLTTFHAKILTNFKTFK